MENKRPAGGLTFQQILRRDTVARFGYLNVYAKKGQIVFTGSSLMEHFPIYEFLEDFDCGLPLKIYNRGVSGFTTQDLRDALKNCVYDLAPKYLFINIGTNDLSDADYSEEALMERYAGILDEIRAHCPETTIYLLAYYPMCMEVLRRRPRPAGAKPAGGRDNARIRSANLALRDLAERCGAVYLDLNEGLADENGEQKEEFAVDGIHMYPNGYKVVLDNLLPLLRKLS